MSLCLILRTVTKGPNRVSRDRSENLTRTVNLYYYKREIQSARHEKRPGACSQEVSYFLSALS